MWIRSDDAARFDSTPAGTRTQQKETERSLTPTDKATGHQCNNVRRRTVPRVRQGWVRLGQVRQKARKREKPTRQHGNRCTAILFDAVETMEPTPPTVSISSCIALAPVTSRTNQPPLHTASLSPSSLQRAVLRFAFVFMPCCLIRLRLPLFHSRHEYSDASVRFYSIILFLFLQYSS